MNTNRETGNSHSGFGNTEMKIQRGAGSRRLCHKTVLQRIAEGEIWPHFTPKDKIIVVLSENTAL